VSLSGNSSPLTAKPGLVPRRAEWYSKSPIFLARTPTASKSRRKSGSDLLAMAGLPVEADAVECSSAIATLLNVGCGFQAGATYSRPAIVLILRFRSVCKGQLCKRGEIDTAPIGQDFRRRSSAGRATDF
jgi:hypothetical protein